KSLLLIIGFSLPAPVLTEHTKNGFGRIHLQISKHEARRCNQIAASCPMMHTLLAFTRPVKGFAVALYKDDVRLGNALAFSSAFSSCRSYRRLESPPASFRLHSKE